MATSVLQQTDAELLRQFVRERAEAAFRTLAERHLDLVFGTALRRTGDRGGAEEITQNVFVALARKAAWLQNQSSLAAWLHRTTVLESRQWWRGESRRRKREQTAAELETTMNHSTQNNPALADMLDEALLELREEDRQAVLLRYFESCNHREVGEALGIGEDAARKRVDRALAQIMTFFRKRGVALGSTAAVAASIQGAGHAAPPFLAATAVRAALCAGEAGAPWLAKCLGMGKRSLAGLGLAVLLVPTVWQQARLVSARGEQHRLEALLALLQSEHAGVTNEMASLSRQIERATAELPDKAGDSFKLPVEGAGDLDARLFHWEEDKDYVRVPKVVLSRIGFDGSRDRWGIKSGSKETLDKERGRVSPALLGALGLGADEQARVQELFRQNLGAYRTWAESSSFLSDMDEVLTSLPKLPNGMAVTGVMKFNDDTRVWVTPSVEDKGNAWRSQFEKGLAEVTGQERAALILRMAWDDGSLAACLQQFGARETFLIVTPDPQGGFWMSQNAEGRNWGFNTPVSFSSVLTPAAEEPFDEAGERREIENRIRERRDQFPDVQIPSVETILETHRLEWRKLQQARSTNVVQIVLGHPLPEPMLEYLRQWRAAHPGTPDAVRPDTLPKHP